ncbi:MAG: cytidine deaminase [Candidatus Eiseniibacteriota bacterium]|nr:MAG: cytidine deaminase [Candidatus Eisenbacteria bacterium]
MTPHNDLRETAKRAMENSRSPFSGLKVGAALKAKSGKVFAGANIETASLGLTICAERVALFSAIAGGEREFEEIAIVSSADEPIPPCGACRQVMWELCGDIRVSTHDLKGASESFKLSELLPFPFEKF